MKETPLDPNELRPRLVDSVKSIVDSQPKTYRAFSTEPIEDYFNKILMDECFLTIREAFNVDLTDYIILDMLYRWNNAGDAAINVNGRPNKGKSNILLWLYLHWSKITGQPFQLSNIVFNSAEFNLLLKGLKVVDTPKDFHLEDFSLKPGLGVCLDEAADITVSGPLSMTIILQTTDIENRMRALQVGRFCAGVREILHGAYYNIYAVERDSKEKVVYGLVKMHESSVTYDTCVPVKYGGKVAVLQMNELYDLFETNKDVLTLTRDGNWKKINRVIRHKTDKQIYDVIQPYGMVSVTQDHGFYAGGHLCSALDFKEKTDYKSELKLDCVKTSLEFEDSLRSIYVPELKRSIKTDEDFACVLGAYIAEGSVTFRQGHFDRCRIVCGRDFAYIKKVYDSAVKIFGKKNVGLHESHGGLGRYVSFANSGRVYSKLFESWCGYQSVNKKLPDWILKTNKKFFETLMYYYQLGDGSRVRNGRVYLVDDFSRGTGTSKSRKLMSQIWFIISSCYKNYYLKFKFNGSCKVNRMRHTYTVFWTDLSRSSAYVKKAIDSWRHRFSWRIPHLKETDGYVYDIEVACDHTFVDCLGMVPMHNTDPSSDLINLGFVKIPYVDEKIFNAYNAPKKGSIHDYNRGGQVNKISRIIQFFSRKLFQDEDYQKLPMSPNIERLNYIQRDPLYTIFTTQDYFNNLEKMSRNVALHYRLTPGCVCSRGCRELTKEVAREQRGRK